MPTILSEKAIWFNDVVLVPQKGNVESREDVPKELHRFIASPMTSVVGKTFAKRATDLGITVCIPRFLDIKKELDIYNSCSIKKNLYLTMGLEDKDRIAAFGKTNCQNYLIDIANGYLPQIEKTIRLLIKNTNIKNIILGNITTSDGYFYLGSLIEKYKLNGIIRCGISNGSGCETYSATGYGSGQFSELVEIRKSKNLLVLDVPVASDGGIKDSGFAAKAFLAGAGYVFIGGMFARSLEAETHISGDSSYYGLASVKAQILSKGKKTRHSEGKEYQIPKEELRPFHDILFDLWGGVSSAVSYSGYKTLTEAIGNGVFQIKENSLHSRERFKNV